MSEYESEINDSVSMSTHKIASSSFTFNDVLPLDIINSIKKEICGISETSYEEARVGNGDNNFPIDITDPKIRISTVKWVDEMNWISSIFTHYMRIANREVWEYDITACQSIQVTRYEKNGHYGWHSDYGTSDDPQNTRKLSASLLLSDPSEYVGGKLQIINYHGTVVSIPKKMGQITFFDARIPHRVAPVLKGERLSLVAWFTGPKLR
jgi:PKHD-type hydroxylase